MLHGFEHNAAAQFFHHDHAFNGPHAHAALIFADIQAAQAQLCQLGVGGAVKAARVRNFAAAVKGVGLVDPFANSVAQLFLIV